MTLCSTIRWALLVAGLTASVACHGKNAPPPTDDTAVAAQDAPPRSPRAHGGQDRTLHMQIHFWAAIDARDALIGADPEAARRSLTWLAEHQHPKDVPAEWQPHLEPMRQAAREAADARSMEALSHGIAQVAERCGECHRQMGTEIAPGEEIDQGLAPEGPELMEDRMGRHAWSVDELWAGLVFPSEEAWQRGVKVLQEMPEEPPREGRKPVSADIAAQLDAIRALGQRAAEATTADQRVEVVAHVLLSCEGCHSGG